METAPSFSQKIYEMLMHSQYWPHQQMVDFQRSQLSQLLRHARATVPFYQNRLDCVFKSNGEIDWDRWNEIPILKREDLRDNNEQLMASSVPAGHGGVTTHFTSGSTGVPVSVTHTEIQTAASNMAALRYCDWMGLNWENPIANISFTDTIRNGEDHVPFKTGPSWWPAERRGTGVEISKHTPPARVLELLKEYKVEYLSISPSRLGPLLEHNEINSNSIKLQKIMCTGVQMLGSHRALYKNGFGAEIFDIYSSMEMGKIAAQCSESGDYHINAEMLFLEIVDENDEDCAPGTIGRVILTPFFSTAQPLIRYEIGDLAEFGEPCFCGRHLPVLKKLQGRANTMFVNAAGKKFRPIFLHEEIAIALQCKAHQIAQVGPNAFEVRYVPGQLTTESGIDAARIFLGETLEHTAKIEFKTTPTALPNNRSKRQIVSQEYYFD